MATKKPGKKKPKSTNGCLPASIILAILVSLSLAATFYFLFLRPGPGLAPPMETPPRAKGPAPATHPPTPPTQAAAKPETPPQGAEKPAPAEKVPASPAPPPSATTQPPRVAIIIDDIGNTKTVAEQLIALDLPLAFSVMPHTPNGSHLAALINARGRDLLIHVPMEATETKKSSGPGMLLLSMPKETLLNTIRQDLAPPYRAIGINNHMGSKFTKDPGAMRVFIKEVKAKKLFFIDSLTAIDSTGYPLARELGVKTAKRDIFLDNDQNPTQIMAQIGRLIALAQRHGSAIGIGHPHPDTLEALRAASPRLSREVTMVPVHELVH